MKESKGERKIKSLDPTLNLGRTGKRKKKKFADETVCWDGQHIEDIVDDEMELTFFLSKRKKNRSEKVGRKKKGGGE